LAFHSELADHLPVGRDLELGEGADAAVEGAMRQLELEAMPASAITLFQRSRPLAQSST
jgi:hypothetical protein